MSHAISTRLKPSKFQPECDILRSESGRPVYGLQDAYLNQSVILVCGGPSLKTLELSRLHQAGIVLAAVNNVATVVRPHIWITCDIPTHFSERIWKDAAILKLIDEDHKQIILKEKDPITGNFVNAKNTAIGAPNTFWYPHGSHFEPSTFFTQNKVPWRTESFGGEWEPLVNGSEESQFVWSSRSVMLVAIRLLYWLGFRRIFLIGCDWSMEESTPYAFPERVDRNHAAGSNMRFRGVAMILRALMPTFREYGLSIWNATEGSRLDVFPRCSYDDAVNECAGTVPKDAATFGLYRAWAPKP